MSTDEEEVDRARDVSKIRERLQSIAQLAVLAQDETIYDLGAEYFRDTDRLAELLNDIVQDATFSLKILQTIQERT